MEMKLQEDAIDCGVVIIQSLHKYYYDNWIPINKLKEKVNYGISGLNLLEITELGKKYGLLLESFEGEFESLQNLELKEPIISLINKNGVFHYIIITKIKHKYIYYYDPVLGKQSCLLSSFKRLFQNVIVIVSKTSYQSKEKAIKEEWFFLNFKTNILTIVISIISIILSFLSTFYMKIILDKIIPNAMNYGLIYITMAFIFIGFNRVITIAIKSIIIRKIENQINYKYLNLYFNKLYFCSIINLNKITKSDHLRRISTIQNISSFKANYLFTLSTEIVTFIVATTFLIFISFNIFIIVLFMSIIMVLISFLFRKNISIRNKTVIANDLDLSTKTMDLIYSQIESKQENYRNIMNKNINNSLIKNLKSNYEMFKLNYLHKTIMELIKISIPFVIIFISSMEIFKSSLSIGDMILFVSIFSFFVNPLDSFLSLILNVPIIKNEIDLLNFVLNFEEEKTKTGLTNGEIKKLTFNKLTFSYELGRNLFYINELTVAQNIKVIGKNGCGKSTFLKVIATYLNADGDYLINDINYENFELESIRKNIFYSSHKTYLPNISILQYLTNNEKERIENIHKYFEKYQLQKIINDFNLKIEDHIINNGSNFSSGQKQLITLLPLLLNEYDLILLDESFENIDDENFVKIKKIIKEKHKNKIFIEVSHSEKYLFKNGVIINFEEFNNG